MGDHADDALDDMMDDDEMQQRLSDIPLEMMDDFEREFMFDEYETAYPFVFSGIGRNPPRKPCGPGKCPVCKSATKPLTNRSTGVKFYGCSRFPKCKGSRDAGNQNL